MPVGPGKYDHLCTHVRRRAQALGAIVIIIEGRSGSGFSMQAPARMTASLPELLRSVADQIEAQDEGASQV